MIIGVDLDPPYIAALKRDNKSYYVYVAFEGDIARYVGFGKGRRIEHINSGVSANYKLNEAHFQGKTLRIEIYGAGYSKEYAQQREILLIDHFKLESEGGTLWNETYGGIGFRSGHTEETKRAIQKRSKEMWNALTIEQRSVRIHNLLKSGEKSRFKGGDKGRNFKGSPGRKYTLKNWVTGETIQILGKAKFAAANPKCAFILQMKPNQTLGDWKLVKGWV